MNGPVYACPFGPTAVTTQVDLVEISPSDDKIVVIHSIYIGQGTELGEAAEEQLLIEFWRGQAMTSGSGGTAAGSGISLSPVGGSSATAAESAFTFETMNTTLATFTAGKCLHRDYWPVRIGYPYRPTPKERISVSQANGGLVVRLGAPADAITVAGILLAEELYL